MWYSRAHSEQGQRFSQNLHCTIQVHTRPCCAERSSRPACRVIGYRLGNDSDGELQIRVPSTFLSGRAAALPCESWVHRIAGLCDRYRSRESIRPKASPHDQAKASSRRREPCPQTLLRFWCRFCLEWADGAWLGIIRSRERIEADCFHLDSFSKPNLVNEMVTSVIFLRRRPCSRFSKGTEAGASRPG